MDEIDFGEVKNAAPFNYTDPDPDFLYGVSGSGRMIYWRGANGSRKVILSKENAAYESLSGAVFTITKGSETITGADINGNLNATSFTSGTSGVFYIGMMDYGVYVLNETTHPSGYSGGPYYYLVVDDDGVEIYKPEDGYVTETLAKEAGDAVFRQRAADRTAATTTP